METNQVVEAVNEVVESLPVASANDKPSIGSIVILVLAGIGLGSSVYFIYKGVRFIATKCKDGSIKIKKVDSEKKKEEKEKKAEKEETQATEE